METRNPNPMLRYPSATSFPFCRQALVLTCPLAPEYPHVTQWDAPSARENNNSDLSIRGKKKILPSQYIFFFFFAF